VRTAGNGSTLEAGDDIRTIQELDAIQEKRAMILSNIARLRYASAGQALPVSVTNRQITNQQSSRQSPINNPSIGDPQSTIGNRPAGP
jgi:hypothetical protein